RADALRDGVLIDVTPTAREAGFRYPVALTAATWRRRPEKRRRRTVRLFVVCGPPFRIYRVGPSSGAALARCGGPAPRRGIAAGGGLCGTVRLCRVSPDGAKGETGSGADRQSPRP